MKNQLRYVRENIRGISREQLSMRSGISRQTIGRIEEGETQPEGITMLKLAKALHVKVEDIFMLEDTD